MVFEPRAFEDIAIWATEDRSIHKRLLNSFSKPHEHHLKVGVNPNLCKLTEKVTGRVGSLTSTDLFTR